MKVLLLAWIWCISFIIMGITCMDCSWLFWLSFIVFAADSIYINKNAERLEREIDELFGN